eukprot:scaffold123678_cov54-Phaeocystis_antarctica.AAC.2
MADRSYEWPSDATTGSAAQAGQVWRRCASFAGGWRGLCGGTPRILSIVIGQTNSLGSSSEPSPNDSRRACRSASPLSSRSRCCACSRAAAFTCTAAANVIACSSAATSVPPSAACSRVDARLRNLSLRVAQEDKSVCVRATSSSTSTPVAPCARRPSALAASFANLASAPPFSSASSGGMAPAPMMAALFASLPARLLSAPAA